MLFYIAGGAPQAVPGTACVEAISTACIEDTCSSDLIAYYRYIMTYIGHLLFAQ
jgi:hypothetical protein